MKTRMFVLLLALVMHGCGGHPGTTSQVKFDAAHSVALDGKIAEGSLNASTADESKVAEEIRAQLKYIVGQLNAIGGVLDLNRLEITIKDIKERTDQRFDVTYSATLLIAWPRERSARDPLQLILPVRGDAEGLSAFHQKYSTNAAGEELCMAKGATSKDLGSFFYYYRPTKASCPLMRSGYQDPETVTRMSMTLAVSAENTKGKYPEYGKIWEDDKLVVTAIFAKNEASSSSIKDPGIAAFNLAYRWLLGTYGRPASTNLAPGEQADAEHSNVQLVFLTRLGTLDVHLYLVDAINQVSEEFAQRYTSRTLVSDFVSYSGHSGLGDNVRALSKLGQFRKGQYQLFMVNGCDSFAYADDTLRQAHHAANPEAGPNKYFDLITNAMPSYFTMNARANISVINALMMKQHTYRAILSQLDPNQRAVVTGEEDNRWPLKF